MSKKREKEEQKKYYLIVETFDRYDSDFKSVSVEALSVECAVVGYLELDEDYDVCDELTIIDGECGRYAGEEHTIGIGPTFEKAAEQYVESRIESG